MVTEVQIKKGRSHLAHLRRIVSCVAGCLGMSREDIEETQNAVSELCSCPLMISEPAEGSLSVRLSVSPSKMVVEITDPSTIQTHEDSGDGLLQSVRCLVDDLEYDGKATIRLTKCVRALERTPAGSVSYVPLVESAVSQG